MCANNMHKNDKYNEYLKLSIVGLLMMSCDRSGIVQGKMSLCGFSGLHQL